MYVSVLGCRCVSDAVLVSCLKVCACVFLWLVTGTDTGAPAGNWAQTSVSHLALETDVWLQALMQLRQKLGQSWFPVQKRERLNSFFRIIFAVLGNIVVGGREDEDSRETWILTRRKRAEHTVLLACRA